MSNTTRGLGLFTAENIVALLRAIPVSDGTPPGNPPDWNWCQTAPTIWWP